MITSRDGRADAETSVGPALSNGTDHERFLRHLRGVRHAAVPVGFTIQIRTTPGNASAPREAGPRDRTEKRGAFTRRVPASTFANTQSRRGGQAELSWELGTALRLTVPTFRTYIQLCASGTEALTASYPERPTFSAPRRAITPVCLGEPSQGEPLSTTLEEDRQAVPGSSAIPAQRRNPSPLAPYSATLEHCGRIRHKLDQLAATIDESMAQLLSCAARDHRAGDLTLDDLGELYARVKDLSGPGFTRLWNERMDVPAGAVAAHVRLRAANRPNGQGGHFWCGPYPYAFDAPRPPKGTAVLYVLYDWTNEPVYVGSTGNFGSRMRNHHGVKDFTWWLAYPCESREAAYLLEDGLLAARKLRLNVKAGR